ncbi:MAG: lytic transglycosylase domain-containing protein [Oscillospiraceae bacterium]|nr:lytic transglycosylase domain-containing protein [Oscillospiraceae bacterium]
MTRRKGKTALHVLTVMVVILLLISVAGLFAYDRFLRETHPLKYTAYVERYASEYGIQPTLVYAVIKTESGFRADAVSNVGARGLMQIMEDTFDWIKFRLGDEETEYYDMYAPETNIRYGCYLLGFLLDEFGQTDEAMAAYHAGRGNVNDWLSDERYSSDGIHLDVIPIADTAHYVNKINKAMDNYVRLYNN